MLGSARGTRAGPAGASRPLRRARPFRPLAQQLPHDPPQPRVGGVGVVARVPGQAHLQRGSGSGTSKATRPSEVARGSVHEVSRPTRSVSRMTKREAGNVPTVPTTRRLRPRSASAASTGPCSLPRRETIRWSASEANRSAWARPCVRSRCWSWRRRSGWSPDSPTGEHPAWSRPAATTHGCGRAADVLRRPLESLCRTRSRGVVACLSPCPPRFSTTAGAADAAGARAGGRLGVAVRAVQALLGAGPARHGRNGPGMRAASRRRRRNRPRAPDRPEAERGPCGLVTRPCGTRR